ncbi:hypothetical protein Tco_0726498 [Tanacetum coccineum]|uniref:Uncharacterized protein n=1 Tax=Tanacetum coccineum TaxID=301880 RepID=A0ABQ4YI99_9ASTR
MDNNKEHSKGEYITNNMQSARSQNRDDTDGEKPQGIEGTLMLGEGLESWDIEGEPRMYEGNGVCRWWRNEVGGQGFRWDYGEGWKGPPPTPPPPPEFHQEGIVEQRGNLVASVEAGGGGSCDCVAEGSWGGGGVH